MRGKRFTEERNRGPEGGGGRGEDSRTSAGATG
jgi:hypothetical protein